MADLSDVARAAGVSKATASRALGATGYVADATRERVREAAESLGYVPSATAASLVTGSTRNVAVVIPHINRWYFGAVLEGIEASLIAAGYDLTLYRLSDDSDQRRRVFDYFLVRKLVDAVISVGIELSPDEFGRLRELGKPVVGIGGPIAGVATLSIDDEDAARHATEHLVSLGHERILHIGGHLQDEMDFGSHALRAKGFRAAMADAGLPCGPDSVVTCELNMSGGNAAALVALADPRSRPTAILAGSDEVAIGTILAARQLGIMVPAQLSVIGIDGHELAPLFRLTTLSQHPEAQGRQAVDMILGAMQGESDEPTREWHPVVPELDVRGSTTAPPAL